QLSAIGSPQLRAWRRCGRGPGVQEELLGGAELHARAIAEEHREGAVPARALSELAEAGAIQAHPAQVDVIWPGGGGLRRKVDPALVLVDLDDVEHGEVAGCKLLLEFAVAVVEVEVVEATALGDPQDLLTAVDEPAVARIAHQEVEAADECVAGVRDQDAAGAGLRICRKQIELLHPAVHPHEEVARAIRLPADRT